MNFSEANSLLIKRTFIFLHSVWKRNFKFTIMYAIVEIAGQQFKVEKDQKIYVHRLEGETGSNVEFDNVLLIDTDKDVIVGAPVISGAMVTAKILDHMKGDKVLVFKKKRRKGYQKLNGHRQYFTQVQIESIIEKGATPKKAEMKKETSAKPEAAKSQVEKPEVQKEVPSKSEPKAVSEKKSEKAPVAEKKTTPKAEGAKTGTTTKKAAPKSSGSTGVKKQAESKSEKPRAATPKGESKKDDGEKKEEVSE